jgi:hypothetical protein
MTALAERFGLAALKERIASLFKRDDGTAVPIRNWNGATSQPTKLQGFDQPLVWVVVFLLALGLVMVYSASVAMPDNPKFTRYSPTHFLTRHALSIVVAFVAAIVVVQIPVSVWEQFAPGLFAGALIAEVGMRSDRSRRMNSMVFAANASSWCVSPDLASTSASATESTSCWVPSTSRVSPEYTTPSWIRTRLPSLMR